MSEEITNNCIFCKNYKEKDVIFETENFFLKVGIGIVCAGHIMIITKKHSKCMGDIEPELLNEFLNLKEKVTNFLSKYVYKPFILENGVIFQSVSHAHTHFIPRKSKFFDEVDLIKDMIFETKKQNNSVEIVEFNSFQDVINLYKKDKEYLYFEQDGKIYCIKTANNREKIKTLKENLSYRNFFKNRGIKGVGNWKTMTEDDKKIDSIRIEETKEIFKNFKDFYTGK